ncbi:MAG: putative toxin-antitoxin system toxin component, PIN family [Gemmatimonadetes bacterium]|nr:putative toxin-antitoxin system toxin component, PIN family [Gemmatimonadota bacterium]
MSPNGTEGDYRSIREKVKQQRERKNTRRPPAPSGIDVRDPDDRWVLASALAGRADVLVTGDKDLLALGTRSPLRIVDPRGFWTLLRAHPPSG